MAVLLEGTSVIFPRMLLDTKYQGGYMQLTTDMPQAGVGNDGELMCFSFFPGENTMQMVGDFLSLLEDRGLTVAIDGKFADVAVVDQLQDYPDGYSCEWLTIYEAVVNMPNASDAEGESVELTEEGIAALPRIKAARLVGGAADGVNIPTDWDYEKSLTKAFGIRRPDEPFVPQN